MPGVSIIITTFRRPELLDRCIRSVLSQDYENVEILLVEDGPTEETKRVAERYRKEIHYIPKPHGGISSSRNVGCKAAKGDFIAFVDDDDLFHPCRITRLAEGFIQYPDAICVFGQASVIDDTDRETGEVYFRPNSIPDRRCIVENMFARQIRSEVSLTTCNTLFKRDVAKRIGFFDESYAHGCEDTDFFVRLALEGMFVGIPDTVALVRGGERSSLTRDALKTARSKLYLMRRFREYVASAERADLNSAIAEREYHWLKVLASGPWIESIKSLSNEDWYQAFGLQSTKNKLKLIRAFLKRDQGVRHG